MKVLGYCTNTTTEAMEALNTLYIRANRGSTFKQAAENVELENEIRQALTPPTVDEVCDALSEYMEEEVIYKEKRFSANAWVICGINKKGLIYINEELLPKLGKMIFEFYEGLQDE